MGRSSKARHERRRYHQRQQRERKKLALDAAREAALKLGSDGKPLKRQRSGEQYVKALRREMANRGYLPDLNGGWKRSAKLDAEPATRKAA